jgi:hypothetical protein
MQIVIVVVLVVGVVEHGLWAHTGIIELLKQYNMGMPGLFCLCLTEQVIGTHGAF